MKHKALIIIALASFALTGCVYVNDDGENDRRNGGFRSNTEPTIGQELLDLDRARASGVISDSEYERAKEAILDDIN